jgi:hypothetical protein
MSLLKTHSKIHMNSKLDEKRCGYSLVAEILYCLQKQLQI